MHAANLPPEPSSPDRTQTADSRSDSPPDCRIPNPDSRSDNAILLDTLDGRLSTLDLCAKHALSIDDYFAWLDQPHIRQALLQLAAIARLRAKAIADAGAAEAALAIATIARADIAGATPAQRSEIRRAAGALLRLASQPQPHEPADARQNAHAAPAEPEREPNPAPAPSDPTPTPAPAPAGAPARTPPDLDHLALYAHPPSPRPAPAPPTASPAARLASLAGAA